MIVRAMRWLAGGLLVATGLLTFGALVLPQLLGWQSYVVTSGSMEPTFGAGAVVVTAPVDPAEILTGDIVTFREPAGVTTHRVTGMTSTSDAGQASLSFTTKGDANNADDPAPLNPQQVLGEAKVAVPHLGYLIELVKAPVGAGALAALFLVVVFTGGGERPRPRASARASTPEPVGVS